MPVTSEDGTNRGGLVQLRQIMTLSKDQQVHLQDVSSSKYRIIDDLQQVRSVMSLLNDEFVNELLDDVFL